MRALVFEADKSAEGKGISASSIFCPDSDDSEREVKLGDAGRFTHTHPSCFSQGNNWEKRYRYQTFPEPEATTA